jgi:FkbM family methyltransferase
VTREIRELLRLAVEVTPLGATPVARARLLLLTLAWPLKKAFPTLRARRVHVELHLGSLDSVGVVLDGRGELEVLREIFVRRIYALPGGVAPRTILDLGSNVGFSVLFFRSEVPGARIVAVEPDPSTFAKLERNVRGIPGVEVVQAAVTGEDGDVEFAADPDSIVSSIAGIRAGTQGTARVRGLALDTLMAERLPEGVDLIKIDIEGAEYDVFASSSAVRDVPLIVGELHDDLIAASREEFFGLLDGFDVETDVPLGGRGPFVASRARSAT